MQSELEPFSPEYNKGVATNAAQEEAKEQLTIEDQLEKQIKEEVKVYGAGKPRRVVLRASIIHD